jgi:hypothetical protein
VKIPKFLDGSKASLPCQAMLNIIICYATWPTRGNHPPINQAHDDALLNLMNPQLMRDFKVVRHASIPLILARCPLKCNEICQGPKNIRGQPTIV